VGPTRHARNGPVALADDIRGRGSPLVLIQGVGIGRWGWEPVADRLTRRFQVITIDNPGIGASDTPPGRYSHLPVRLGAVHDRQGQAAREG
jgi:pimeloyl-ACP methyl ester carboxylesterase